MAIYPTTIVQIEEINRKVIEGIDNAIEDVFKSKVNPLKSEAKKVIDIKQRIDKGLMRKNVESGFSIKKGLSTLFVEDSAIRPNRDTDYVSFQEFGTKKISPALFLTTSFNVNTKDIPQLLDKETQDEMNKL